MSGLGWLMLGLALVVLSAWLHVREWRLEREEMRRIRGWDHE